MTNRILFLLVLTQCALCAQFSLLVSGLNRGAVSQTDTTGVACSSSNIKAGLCFGGFARRETLLNQWRAASSSPTFTLDIGEVGGLGTYFRFFDGAVQKQLMERLAYDAVSVSKADLFRGPEVAATMFNSASFGVVSANLQMNGAPLRQEPYKVINRGGISLGITSVFDPKRATQTNLGAITVSDMVASLALTVGELRGRGVTLVVLLAPNLRMPDIRALATSIPGVDVILTNKEDSESVTQTIKGTQVQVCVTCENGIGLMRLVLDTPDGDAVTVVSATETSLDKTIAEAAGTAAVIAGYDVQLADLAARSIIGSLSATAVGDRSVCRFRSCSMGNMVADILQDEAGVDIAFINSGGIRANLTAGSVSLSALYVALPFGDNIATFSLKGGDLVKALQYSVRGPLDGVLTGRFLQVSRSIKFGYINESSLVTEIFFNGQPLDLGRTYRMATLTFSRQGGDGYDVLATQATDVRDNGRSLKDIITEVLAKRSPVTPPSEARMYFTPFAANASVLSVCPGGTELLGEFGCSPCPAGKARAAGSLSAAGQQLCRDCLDGFFQDVPGATQCKPCPANARTFVAGARNVTECLCAAGFFGTPGSTCSPCPHGGFCPGGTKFPLAAHGFIASPLAVNSFRQCLPADACPGDESLASAASAFDQSSGLRVNSTSRCGPGYGGANCGSCADGFFRMGLFCRPCKNSVAAVALTGLIVVFFIGGGFTILSVYTSSDRSIRRRGLIGILVFVLQILALFRAFFPLSWPTELTGLADVLSIANISLDVFHLECTTPLAAYSKFVLGLLLPVIFAVVLGLYWLLLRATRGGEKQPGFRASVDLSIRTAFVVGLNFSYVYLSSLAFSVFDCSYEDDGTSWLAVSPSVPCYAGEWTRWIGVAVPAILVYSLGIPAAMVFFIRHELTDGKFRGVVNAKSFCDEFAPGARYFGPILILWRLVFIILKATVPQQQRLRGALGVLLLIILVIGKSLAKVRRDRIVQTVDITATAAVLSVYFWGLTTQSVVVRRGETIAASVFLWFSFFSLIAIVFGAVAVFFASSLYRMRRSGSTTDVVKVAPALPQAHTHTTGKRSYLPSSLSNNRSDSSERIVADDPDNVETAELSRASTPQEVERLP